MTALLISVACSNNTDPDDHGSGNPPGNRSTATRRQRSTSHGTIWTVATSTLILGLTDRRLSAKSSLSK